MFLIKINKVKKNSKETSFQSIQYIPGFMRAEFSQNVILPRILNKYIQISIYKYTLLKYMRF